MTDVRTSRWWRSLVTLLALALAATMAAASAEAAPGGDRGPRAGTPAEVALTLTILHNNDGESQLVNAPGQPSFGGIARFATLVDRLRDEAVARPTPGPERGIKRGALMISSGDNFLAGPRWEASLRKGVPFYDSIGLKAIGYDAMVIGNHEFDFGPDVFADFVAGFEGTTTFLSANLDVTDEPRLRALADRGVIASSVVVRVQGERIGLIGATTPLLPFISSPGNVKVLQDVAGIVQAEVDAMTRRGIDKVIFVSHLQNIAQDRALIRELRGIDVAIAGGGDELLANPGDLLVPGDPAPFGPYPILETDAEGRTVPIITTPGDYKYVGRLVVDFDRRGNVVSVHDSSGPVRVSGVAPDAVAPNPFIQANVVDPVVEFISVLAANVVGSSEVALEGRRPPIRLQETNLGNLMADSLLSAANKALPPGVPAPRVALQNGGGIRNASLIPPGPITELTTFDIAAFSNFVTIVPDVPRDRLRALVEHGISALPAENGQFGHWAGLEFTYSLAQPAGSRVQSLELADGTVIVAGGSVVDGPPVTVATIDFLALGGDRYPFGGLAFVRTTVTYQQALLERIRDDLGGVITGTAYPEGGEGRIVAVP
jgi:2',3'-cyclic-nucleotide 2'-phosphodiesterase (5'-nucleotidase family)